MMAAMPPAPLALPLRLALAAATILTLSTTACTGDDDDVVTPPVDAANNDGTQLIDAPPGACNLPTTPITCTVGNDAPCTAACGTAYCYNFSQFGVVCTKACTVVGDCPTGWSCNMMGRCRPPN